MFFFFFFGKNGQHFPHFDPQNWRIECMKKILGQIKKNKRRTVLELVAHGPDGAMMICKMFPPAAPPPSRSHPWHRLLGPFSVPRMGASRG